MVWYEMDVPSAPSDISNSDLSRLKVQKPYQCVCERERGCSHVYDTPRSDVRD